MMSKNLLEVFVKSSLCFKGSIHLILYGDAKLWVVDNFFFFFFGIAV